MTRKIVVHGGSTIVESERSVAGLSTATAAGWNVLATSGDAVAAAVAAVVALEDDPQYNAGTGAVTTATDQFEYDAAIVDGSTGDYAGIAAVKNVKNPVLVAADLLNSKAGPVLLVGDGATQYAQQRKVGGTPLNGASAERPSESELRGDASDTVGCLVVDGGRLVVASSTGGVTGQLDGRVGDAPIIGAGLYADDRIAVVCSGEGEWALRNVLAMRTAMTRLAGDSLDACMREALERMPDGVDMALFIYDRQTDELAVGGTEQPFLVVAHDDSGPRVVPNDLVYRLSSG